MFPKAAAYNFYDRYCRRQRQSSLSPTLNPQVQELSFHEAEIITGDFNNMTALEKGAQGSESIFINTFPTPAAFPTGEKRESFLILIKLISIKY